MIGANQFKSGLTLEIDGELMVVVDYVHVKPGKGGAFVRTKMRNMRNKKIMEKTYRIEEKFQDAFVEEKKMQYMYRSSTDFHFMDQETYEEVAIPTERIVDITGFLKINMDLTVIMYKNEIIEARLPMFINLKITETEPGFKGDTAKSSFKPAKVETGATVQVPLFVNESDVIKIDTRTGTYVERV